MVEYIITGEPQRTERFDYPFDAIREIVINMVVHRDYRDSSASIIKIFDDRIEFFNPGRLYDGITLQDLLSGNYTSRCRNKLIAMAFKGAGLIERYGSGIQRILRICHDYGIIPPVFEEHVSGFKVTLFKEKVNVTEDVAEGVAEDVTEDRSEIILKLIVQIPDIKADKLAERLNVTRRTIYRDLKKLKREGKIKRTGSDKCGYWELV
jgi:ATP-dependent DNA helicase RecG